MTGLRILAKWAPSQRPYAFDTGSLSVNGRITAVWAGRKMGRTTVTLGQYHIWSPSVELCGPVDEQLGQADTRYGGSWWAQWDGQHFLAEPSWSQDPGQHQTARELLARVLAGLPRLPGPRWIGWYYR